MNELLSDIAVYAGISSAILSLLDWLLSRRQKEWIRDVATKTWLWIDCHRSWKIFNIMRSQIFINALLIIPAFIFVISLYRGVLTIEDWMQALTWVLLLAVGLFVQLLIIKKVYAWVLRDSDALRVSMRAIPILMMQVFAVLIFFIELPPDGAGIRLDISLFILIFIRTIFISAAVPFMSITIPSLFVIAILIPIVLVMRAMEIIVLRIAEHEKGPVIGAATLLTGVGMIIKSFSN